MQRKFADLYLSGMYATKALRMAGYGHEYANKHAHRLLQREEIKAYIKVQRERMAKETAMERAEVVNWLCRVILTPLARAENHHRDLLQYERIRVHRDGTTSRRIRMVDKMAAIRLLVRLMGWDRPEEVEVRADVRSPELEEVIRKARELGNRKR